MFCLGGFCPGGFWQGGFCPGGFWPGVYVRGVLSGGVVLIPYKSSIDHIKYLFLGFSILPIWDPKDLGSVYTRSDPFGTGTKLVRISLVFTRDLADPVWIGSAIWYQMGPIMKLIPYGTVPFQFRTGPM